jgi:phage gp29-like protein
VNRLVAYVLEREGGNWLGQSLLRSAYKNWLLKDRALRTWSTSIDRNGIGVPIYTAAEGEATLDAGEALATSVRSGDNAGGAVPNGAKLELMGVSGALPDIDKFVRYHDEQIARSALGHFLNLGTQTGSWALGSTFADFFTLSLQAVAEMVRDTATSHIVEDLVDLNFGPTVPAPQIVFDEIGSRTTELDRVREAAGLASDADLTKFLRAVPNQEATDA